MAGYDKSFSSLKKKEKKFNAKMFCMSNDDDLEAYCSLMTNIENKPSEFELVTRREIQFEQGVIFNIFLEWKETTLHTVSPFTPVNDENKDDFMVDDGDGDGPDEIKSLIEE